MSRSHDRLTHTLRPFKTSLRTGATSVVPMRATESGKCQTSITFRYECYECATNDIPNASWLCVNLALALNTQSLETGQCKADGSSHGSLVVPIELAITCIIFVSDHQLLNKLLSILGSGLKTKHTCFQRECKQDARL